MNSQRALQQTVRRLAVGRRPVALGLSRFSPAAASLTPARYANTISSPQAESVTRDEGMTILANQRLHRPVAPHLSIYKPQITWYLSALNRITGTTLSGGLYVFGAAYLIFPYIGLGGFTAAGMAASFAKWPLAAKVIAKMVVAFPFSFHSFNGLRHLIWDTGSQMTNVQVIRTGWTVVGLTVLTSLGLALFV